jgi:transposase-like protein
MIQNCPDCGLKVLKNLGIERGGRLGDNCTVLITRYRCKDCGCEFRELQITHWETEIIEHSELEKSFMEA